MEKLLKKIAKSSLFILTSFQMILMPVLHADFDPGLVTEMPNNVEMLIRRIENSKAQLATFEGRPGLTLGVYELQGLYTKQIENLQKSVNTNTTIMGTVSSQMRQAVGDAGIDFSSCMEDDVSGWRQFKKSLDQKERIKKMTNEAYDRVGNSFSLPSNLFENNNNSYVESSRMYQAFSEIGSYLGEGFEANVRSCCKKLRDLKKEEPTLCKSAVREALLAPLEGLENISNKFIDPMHPGMVARNLTQEDVVALAGAGELSEFINATDFNTSVTSLVNAGNKCNRAKEDAITKLSRKGQNLGLFSNMAHVLRCNVLPNMAQNWQEGTRESIVGLVDAKVTLPWMNSVCSDDVVAAAHERLIYTTDQFMQQANHMLSLPPGVNYSYNYNQKGEVDISSYGNSGFSLNLNDGFGNIVDSVFVPGLTPTANLDATSNVQGPGTVSNSPGSVSNTSLASDSTSGASRLSRTTLGKSLGLALNSPKGASVSKGLERLAKEERLSVRRDSSKIMDGDLMSARTMAASVKSRKEGLKALLGKSKSSKGLSQNRKNMNEIGARSKGLAESYVSTKVARGVARTFKSSFKTLKRALGLGGGRDVERVGSNSESDNKGSGTTSKIPDYVDRRAQEEFEIAKQKKSRARFEANVRKMADGINQIGQKLSEIVNAKNAAIAKFFSKNNWSLMYARLKKMGADERSDAIVKMNKEYVNNSTKLVTLNTQELGLRTAIATAKMSMKNYLIGAQLFEDKGIQLKNRGPASVPVGNQQFFMGQNQQVIASNFGANPTTPVNNFQGYNNNAAFNGTALARPNVASNINQNNDQNQNFFSPSMVNSLAPGAQNTGLPQGVLPPQLTIPSHSQGGSDIDTTKAASLKRFFDVGFLASLILPSAHASISYADLIEKQFSTFLNSYEEYTNKLESSSVELKQNMVENYVLFEREARAEGGLTDESRLVLGAYTDTLRTEMQDLSAMRKSKKLSTNNASQIYKYIEEMERDTQELTALVEEEASLALEQKLQKDPSNDPEAWTGVLPSLALE